MGKPSRLLATVQKVVLSFLLLMVSCLGMQLQSQVVASFAASAVSGCSPMVVSFTNTSTGGPFTSVAWDLGNGNTSTSTNAGANYISPGTYTVHLVVRNGLNADSVTQVITVYQNPDVFITANPASGCDPLLATFTDNSILYSGSTVASTLWDFGDGVTSTAANPSHLYAGPGNYTVVLSIVDNHGCVGTLSPPTTVFVDQPFTANFTGSPTSGCNAPINVQFTDASIGPGTINYQWNFGDGSPLSNIPNPSHTYSVNGVYDVTLIISNGGGCSDTLVRPHFIAVSPLTAGFTQVGALACTGAAVTFQDTSVGLPTAWAWNFGDGGTSSAQNPTHVYAAPGFYNVQLTVTRPPGCADVELRNAYVQVLPSPTAAFTATNDTNCGAPLTTSFTSTSTGAVSYAWNFGDPASGPSNFATTANAVHTYSTAGNFTVTLVVTSANGCTSTLTRINAVQIVPPVASFTFVTVQSGCLPRTVNFTNTSTTTYGVITGYDWDFGDGFTSNVVDPVHTYFSQGSWTVSLIVHTSLGCSDTLTIPNFISTGINPVANFPAQPITACIGQSVSFTDLSTNANGWTWDFGDGTTSTLQNPTHAYNAIGCYRVTLTASNFGCVDVRFRNNYVCVVGTRAAFTPVLSAACDTPLVANFVNTSSGAGLTAKWDFGDPASGPLNTATTFNASHVYHSFGIFTVKLVSIDLGNGCRDSITHTVRITKPKAALNLNTNGGCAPLTVAMLNGSMGSAPLSYQWTFGDGGTSTATNPSHIYASAGIFTPQLIVVDANGCRDTVQAASPIVMHAANAIYTASTLIACPNDLITFTSNSTSDSPITNQIWSFGDGSANGAGTVVTHAFTTPGAYPVRLLVIDANGCSRTHVKIITIVKPVPIFNISPALLCPNESFTFTNASTGAPTLGYAWDFGDGNTSNTLNPTHAYAANGNYPVKLVVTDANGCRDSIIHIAQVQAPVANFIANYVPVLCPPLLVNFSNISTGNIASYAWDFGDGGTSNVANPSHLYSQSGSFTVILVVTTATGCADTMRVTNQVVVNAPTATFTFDDTLICEGKQVQFILSPAGSYVSSWDFGDGTALIGLHDTITHTYAAPGNYTPSLVVGYPPNGQCLTPAPNAGTIRVLPRPSVRFVYADTFLCRADSVLFTDSTSYGGGPGQFSWSFGDGGVDTVQNPVHYYAQPGTYTVTLAVTDTLGCSDANMVFGAVRLFDFGAGFSVAPMVTCPGSAVTFSDSSHSDDGLNSWIWDFGDATGGNGDTVTHSYGAIGNYNVTLVITTDHCADTLTVPNAVQVQQPNGSFAISADTSCPGVPIDFQFNGAASITQLWYFGNGDSLYGGASVPYAYPAPGTYLPSVMLKDSIGCTHLISPSLAVTILPGPIAAMALDTTVFCRPDSVHFWDMSTYASGVGGVQWNFGDGATALGSNVTHYYGVPGAYDVILSVVDGLGCVGTDTVVRAVYIHQQSANFGIDTTTGCLPLAVQFTDSSLADTTIVNWAWSFGDGGTRATGNPAYTYIDTGYFDVQLVVTSAFGCMDTVSFPMLIDIHVPSAPPIWAASVDGDNTVSVLFHSDSSATFSTYQLWEEQSAGSFLHISSTYLPVDTLLLDLASNSLVASRCYRPRLSTICGDTTQLPQTRVHCTMELSTISGNGQVTLLWTPYVGWDSISRYEVFAVNGYTPATGQLLATLPGNANGWVDTALTCGQLRAYRIRATGLALPEVSWSDTSQSRPGHQSPTYQPAMVTATVINNADVQVTWENAPLPQSTGYDLFRSLDGVAWTNVGHYAAGTTNFFDATANVGAQSYYYRIVAADSCGYFTVPSPFARSILLQLDGSDGTAQLDWNAYGTWANGVARYDLEAQPQTGGNWTLVGNLASNTLNYHDLRGLPGEAGVCYRVTAYESGGNQARSQSNIVCLSTELWVPNTITPNNDGRNDVLEIRALAAFPGTGIDIYNRWGNLVYQTNDYQNNWAGTNGNTGASLPDGTYFWVLHVSDGRTLKGYVTILR